MISSWVESLHLRAKSRPSNWLPAISAPGALSERMEIPMSRFSMIEREISASHSGRGPPAASPTFKRAVR